MNIFVLMFFSVKIDRNIFGFETINCINENSVENDILLDKRFQPES